MSSLEVELSHLRRADRHLVLAMHLIYAQENRLRHGRASGWDIQLTEELLTTLRAISSTFEIHRHAITEAIERELRPSLNRRRMK